VACSALVGSGSGAGFCSDTAISGRWSKPDGMALNCPYQVLARISAVNVVKPEATSSSTRANVPVRRFSPRMTGPSSQGT
jgi:hypothetical protein